MSRTKRPYRVVEKSPLYDLIDEMVQDGWGATAILRNLRATYGLDVELPAYRTLATYVEKHRPVATQIPPRMLEEKVAKLDQKIELYGRLSAFLRLIENRLLRGMDTEEKMEGLLNPQVDRAVETWLSILNTLWDAGVALGIYPRRPRQPAAQLDVAMSMAARYERVDLRERLQAIAAETGMSVEELVVEAHAVIREVGLEDAP